MKGKHSQYIPVTMESESDQASTPKEVISVCIVAPVVSRKELYGCKQSGCLSYQLFGEVLALCNLFGARYPYPGDGWDWEKTLASRSRLS